MTMTDKLSYNDSVCVVISVVVECTNDKSGYQVDTGCNATKPLCDAPPGGDGTCKGKPPCVSATKHGSHISLTVSSCIERSSVRFVLMVHAFV